MSKTDDMLALQVTKEKRHFDEREVIAECLDEMKQRCSDDTLKNI